MVLLTSVLVMLDAPHSLVVIITQIALVSFYNITNCNVKVHDVIRNNFYPLSGIHGNSTNGGVQEYAEVTVVPVATAGPCTSPCKTIYPFLILLFFMTFVVATTQMPLLMIVLRSEMWYIDMYIYNELVFIIISLQVCWRGGEIFRSRHAVRYI